MPAFATSTSTGPCASSATLNAASTCAVYLMSQAATVKSSTGSPDLDVTVRSSPPSASRRAIARPMPRLPPVTSTDRPICSHCLRFGGAPPVRSERTGPDLRPRPGIGWPLVEMQTTGRIDPEFTAYPLRGLADAALQRAAQLGASHADFRAERIRGQQIGLSDGNLETQFDSDDLGLAVRVVVDGTWGFASAVDLTAEAAAHAAAEAVDVARVASAMNTEPIELADEPAHGEVTWVSAYEIDPFEVGVADKIALLANWSGTLLRADGVDHVDASLYQVKECKFYTDGATTALQQRVRVHPSVTAVSVGADGRFETMRTLAPPAGRGYEYLAGTGWDFAAELAEIPELLAAKLAAPSVEAGRYDLVIDPSNLFLTIHESIGHATELDRALGYEAAYAGTSFATFDKLGTLQYGSPIMHVTGDRTTEHGLATIGYDDEGVAGQSWDLIAGGVLA